LSFQDFILFCWEIHVTSNKHSQMLPIVTISKCDLYVCIRIHVHIHVYVHMHLCKPHKLFWAQLSKTNFEFNMFNQKIVKYPNFDKHFSIKNYLNEINKCMILNFIQRFVFKTIIPSVKKRYWKYYIVNK
jgi:hypothetical protein